MHSVYSYILVMAVVTYLIRAIPLTLIRTEIKNNYIKSFLYYVPYATLAAMTFPAILHASDNMIASTCGFITAIILAIKNKSLLTVAVCSCVVVFIVELFV
ncbi:MAG: AzlD domain-containing protein [Butyrivibrio sp.]|nr:AzlD domain-containing protein [Butyrivibrio sp.]